MLDNEAWIVEAGDQMIQKIASGGIETLDRWEKLVYCLWVADYGMRNAGDLETASEVYPGYQSEGRQAARDLSLQATLEAFSLDGSDLELRYFSLFDQVCGEIRGYERRRPM